MFNKQNRKAQTQRRHRRLRVILSGTTERPRLAVYRSGKHIYAQIIDDTKGVTIAAASSIDKELREKLSSSTGNINAAAEVGKLVAERAKKQGISSIVFDRGGFIYHGRVAALADAAREVGLEF
ncbi:MAG: 50S ribosomal protein L18 [Candidatus Gastranaerophilaceae bacterium]|jgi:large subunit ribosomal protein L18